MPLPATSAPGERPRPASLAGCGPGIFSLLSFSKLVYNIPGYVHNLWADTAGSCRHSARIFTLGAPLSHQRPSITDPAHSTYSSPINCSIQGPRSRMVKLTRSLSQHLQWRAAM